MKQTIVSRWNANKVLFECDLPDDTPSCLVMRHTLEKAAAHRPRADLRGAYLRGAYLRDADLQGADLQGADLHGADLQGADLHGADLRGADLQGADLRGADLQDAYLRDADLQGADLQDADLQGADLQGADLQGADLQGADLRGADGQQLPRATPAQAIENLDKVREIVLDNEDRLNMRHWHGDEGWRDRTCAEETLCGTTHCMAGWLQVCTTEPALKTVEASLAGLLAAPIASKMFYLSDMEALEWLRDRKYVAEIEEAQKRLAARKAKLEAAQGGAA